MARFADLVFNSGLLAPQGIDPEEVYKHIVKFVVNKPGFIIDNVAEFVARQVEKDWDLTKLPCIAPPFESFWMEYLLPLSIRQVLQEVGWNPKYVGIAFNSAKNETEWLLGGEVFLLVHREQEGDFVTQGPYGRCVLVLNEQGELINDQGYYWELAKPMSETPESSLVLFGKLLLPCLVAITFLHCKNVTTKIQQTPFHTRKNYESRYGRPLIKQTVINIDPAKKILKTEGDISKVGLKKALHICRGHFKQRKTGLFWWGPHVRGNVENGEVKKSYNVKAPGVSR